MAQLAQHHHGKSRVRVARVWKDGGKHYFADWTVDTLLDSDMAHAFLTPSNADMTATDTQKNTVYYIAKQLTRKTTTEEFAFAIAKHLYETYPKVSCAKVRVAQAAWDKRQTPEGEHVHGFEQTGAGNRTAYVTYGDTGVSIQSGLQDWKVLKTTQSGYEGFLQDEYTRLPPSRERLLATAVTASWKYSRPLPDYDAAFTAVQEALAGAFFGNPTTGIYSPSVQYTLFHMGKAALAAVSTVDSIHLKMPNLHYHPCHPVNSPGFDDDVYVATSEPHGSIEAVVTRNDVAPHARL